ncbi:MAG: FAD-dependent oxidoreductase [Anaerolineaceae bacterium]|nr:FAD-dependent oxidoreductase [Anaerolineaceae bacterium]
MNEREAPHHVAIIGGGPAGLFAARELAERHIHSVIFNRDIKPGGLAEYGIYPTKLKMKEGLRNQFRQILARNEIEYYGNILVGDHGDISLDDLRALGFDALLVTVGAQSTKRLGIPGEELSGVYHAKDIVYHYNLLPPYSENVYSIGMRVAVIGVGNVMVDVAHWLIDEKGVEKVIAIARRGPADVKFDRKELEEVIGCLDIGMLVDELDRVAPVVLKIGQDPTALLNVVREVALKMPNEVCNSSLSLRFLSTPVGILGNENGSVKGLQVEENRLVLTDDGLTRPVGTGNLVTLDVDTVIYAIGDEVDAAMGLPVLYGEFDKNPQPRFPVDGVSYELFDPQTNQPIPDIFLAGWARKPSVGLVGIARKDAVNSIQAVSRYLETIPTTTIPVSARVRERMFQIGKPVIDKQALQRLENLEKDRAKDLNVASFKFASNEEMLQVLDLV